MEKSDKFKNWVEVFEVRDLGAKIIQIMSSNLQTSNSLSCGPLLIPLTKKLSVLEKKLEALM